MAIRTWADVVTIHPISGPAIIEALKAKTAEIGSDNRGTILVAQMSSAGNLISSSYTARKKCYMVFALFPTSLFYCSTGCPENTS